MLMHDDQVVASTVYPSLKNRCFYVLREVSATHGILPKSYFPHGVTLTDTNPHTSGRFSDTWEGQQSDGNQVCVKAFRAQTAENLYKIKRVCNSPQFQRESELSLILIRGSTVRSWCGSIFHTQTCCPSSEYRRHCFRFA